MKTIGETKIGDTWEIKHEDERCIVLKSSLSNEVMAFSKQWRDRPPRLEYTGRWEDLYPFYMGYLIGDGK